MNTFQKKYTFQDYLLLSLYNQLFWPNNLVLGLLLLVQGYLHLHDLVNVGYGWFFIQTALGFLMLYAIIVLFVFIIQILYTVFGFYKNKGEDNVTFGDESYTVANPSRELKFFWKDVVVCRMSDFQMFIYNDGHVGYRLSRPGFSDEQWAEIVRFIKGKVKTAPLFPYTLGMTLGLILGLIRLFWVLAALAGMRLDTLR